MLNSMLNSKTMNPDIARARSRATFDPLKLTHFLYQGPQQTRRKRFIQNLAAKEIAKEGFKKYSEMSREELWEQSLKKVIYLARKCEELNLTNDVDKIWFQEILFPNESSPLTIHKAAFVPTIEKLASQEQKEKWMPLIKSYEMMGSYGQTELGHGSFLRGLETTAIYDPSTKEFVVDSPTITSSKFWPGGLGIVANHCVIMAKLINNGRDYGMQSFLVPVRDINTHRPLPGVSVGDIGTKFGLGEIDNGYLRLDNVRIPRENMLSRYSQVLEDGTFVPPKNTRLLYGSMTFLRTYISSNAAKSLAKAVTIATRYSAVRIQSEINAGMGEVPVLEFQTQQYKLFVQLATSYALILAGRRVQSLYEESSAQIEKGNFESLPVLHAVSSGLKAFSTWATSHGIEQCRFACGGHGYLQASGLPKLYAFETPSATFEGENTVLLLQTARFVNKCFEAGQSGINLPPGLSFLTKTVGKSRLTEKLELEHLVTAFEYRAAILAQEGNRRLKDHVAKGMPPGEAWNNSSQSLVEAAMAFCHVYIVRAFVEAVQSSNLGPSLCEVMTCLCQLYAAHGITQNAGQFAKGGFLSGAQLGVVQSKVYDLLGDIKPNAVALVDAFDFPDEVLQSAIGRYDGNVYEALMESARTSKLNQNEVHQGIIKYVKPYVEYLKHQKGPQARL